MWAAGRCLHELVQGADTPRARAGAMLVAEAIDLFRQLHTKR